MTSIKDIRMKPKLIGAFLLAGLIPLVILAVISMNKSQNELMQQAFNQLQSVQQIKKNQVQTFFGERLGDVQVLADNPYTRMAAAELIQANGNAKSRGSSGSRLLEDSGYMSVHDTYFKTFKYYMDTYGYFDVFLIDADQGDVYSHSLQRTRFRYYSEPGKYPSLQTVAKNVSQTEGRSFPTWNLTPRLPVRRPCLFACPVKDEGKTIGILALQISNDAINAIMQERSGMGETGETYLVGSDKRMRSDSYLDPTGHSVAASFKGTVQANGVDTDAANNALEGKSNIEIISDYNGNPVLSAYDPLELPGGIRWAVIAEIDQAEVEAPIIAFAQFDNHDWRDHCNSDRPVCAVDGRLAGKAYRVYH